MTTHLEGSCPETSSVLGIDIGSVSISLVQMDLSGKVLHISYLFHKGQIRETLRVAGKAVKLDNVKGIACCSAPSLDLNRVRVYDPRQAVIRASRELCRESNSILQVGAEKFMVIRLDRNGKFESVSTNSSCAAGTGSFLDQQAARLNLKDTGELCSTALGNTGVVPDIASRCSVFAKTDLIHAQAEGYPMEAICDSLCRGLAKNIADTLFSAELPLSPVLFTGGVSKNEAVVKHLEELLNIRFLRHEHSHVFGAYGACRLLLDNQHDAGGELCKSLADILLPEMDREYCNPPLLLTRSAYPDFAADQTLSFKPEISFPSATLQVDLYQRFEPGTAYRIYLGVDIGSTSTKAIITTEDNVPLAGFYTYTAGKPIDATRSIFEAIDDLIKKAGVTFVFLGVGTTGSGRKFVGKILHADLVADEITAHAKAAYQLNPLTDTIIEIGGQDSKFTLMHDGVVTFSQMNAVCAAGTGSFIDELARKLGCSLTDYSKRTEGVSSPLASDRCTVFMERDMTQLQNKGYSVDEILATALHSVMENYLRKVAIEGSIGNNICFQGATAKNRSLVAAFEQRLGKEIFVSKYCHLAGALGITILLQEMQLTGSGFRGISFFRENIVPGHETCLLCNNRCVISIASVNGVKESYGFLCGREPGSKNKTVNRSGIDLPGERKKIFEVKASATDPGYGTIGIPAALHLFEELSLWKRFFLNLSIRPVTSERFEDSLKSGKRIAGAEFCAPVNSYYGHVAYLADKADVIFLPVVLDKSRKPENADHNYCYYTQYSPSLAYTIGDPALQKRCLSPILTYSRGPAYLIRQLHQSLSGVYGASVTRAKVKSAYEEALRFFNKGKGRLVDLFNAEFQKSDDISAMLLGRPYVVLSDTMNKGIPDIFSGMGVHAYYMDMIPREENLPEETGLSEKLPWHYAGRIMEAASYAALTDNIYPVLITAFKCSPDAFIIEFFKKLMNKSGKPFLILQIDDHDSNVGYETRIEAAVRSFRNHAANPLKHASTGLFPVLPSLETSIDGKTLLFPSWDPVVTPLLVANLRRAGIDARMLQSSEKSIKKSMAHNTGQCLPVSIIAQEFIEYVNDHKLSPEKSILWMTRCWVACNLRLYPHYIKNLFDTYGNGFEKATVYYGELTHLEISLSAGYHGYFAYLLGGLLRKTGCRLRPYEVHKGETDEAMRNSVDILKEAFLGNCSMDDAVSRVVSLFDRIEIRRSKRPGVAIFGDLYVRDNEIMNQDLVHDIEKYGGEVITTPYTDLVKLTFDNVLRRKTARGDYYESAVFRVLMTSLRVIEDKYYRKFRKFIGKKPEIHLLKLEKHLAEFNIHPYNSGESYENILKIFYILDNHPDVSLFVQTNPAYCCPALVTEAMTHEIKRITGIPVVTLTYDGTDAATNDIIAPYLQ